MQRKWLRILTVAAVVGAVCPQAVHALPAFARREGQPCQMCHFRVPELNETGKAYLRRGVRQAAGGEEATSEAPTLGAPFAIEWSKYLSIMGIHEFSAEKGSHPQFNAGEVDLWAAGPFDSHWSAVANGIMDVQAGGSDVDQGYAQYLTNRSERFGSVRFGQMLPFAVLLNGADPSLAISAPLVLSSAPDNGSTWMPNSFLRGAELGFVDTAKWNAYLGFAQPRLDLQSDPAFQNHTDWYASGEYIVNPKGDSISAYGYWGHSWLATDATSLSFHRVGVFGNAYFTKSKVILGYMSGRDKDSDGDTLKNTGWFAQPEYLLTDKASVYARYDHFKQDMTQGGALTMRGPTIGVSYWAATPVKLTLEAQFLKTTGQPASRSLTAQVLWSY